MIINYEETINQKDALISQLNEMLNSSKNKSDMLKKKNSLLEINAIKFKEDLPELHSNLKFKQKEIELFKNDYSQYEGELLICKNKLKVIEKLSRDELCTISLLQTKIIDCEEEIIHNHKTLEGYKSAITLLQIKSTEKSTVINTIENKLDELSIINKSYEKQIFFQSEKIISYLEKIEELQNSIKILEEGLEEATISANSSILKRIFNNSN